jgi:hypothetical protein
MSTPMARSAVIVPKMALKKKARSSTSEPGQQARKIEKAVTENPMAPAM